MIFVLEGELIIPQPGYIKTNEILGYISRVVMVEIIIALGNNGRIISNEKLERMSAGAHLKAKRNIWRRVARAVFGNGLIVVGNHRLASFSWYLPENETAKWS